MTKGINVLILIAFASICGAIAQDSLTPTPSPTTKESASPSPTPEQTPSASPARSVRISFVPPPLEGTISLGIYDGNGKLVRVLHQEAELNEFIVGADALVTQWDGKNDDGEDLSAGKYHARGYAIGHVKIEETGKTQEPPLIDSPDFVRVKLVANPLENNERPIVELKASSDNQDAYLTTKDGLPLLTVAQIEDSTDYHALLSRADKSIDFFILHGTITRQFRISNIDKMMAFDCGDFELK
ncbi:MAG: hypothetical protein DMF22_11265 [Verrucomicrobia bacterium]|nr:MAG: hypothetical protein DME81_08690 [Verrucomicrobiota bacterium]PYL69405.1 MAG: hypothetical protein DMF22_11265 [Verrucomicrobiota bacterium]